MAQCVNVMCQHTRLQQSQGLRAGTLRRPGLVMQGLRVDVHGLADGLKGLVEAGLAKAAGQHQSTLCLPHALSATAPASAA